MCTFNFFLVVVMNFAASTWWRWVVAFVIFTIGWKKVGVFFLFVHCFFFDSRLVVFQVLESVLVFCEL